MSDCPSQYQIERVGGSLLSRSLTGESGVLLLGTFSGDSLLEPLPSSSEPRLKLPHHRISAPSRPRLDARQSPTYCKH